MASSSPSEVAAIRPGSSSTSSSPASAIRIPSWSSDGSTVARKPIVPKLTAKIVTRRPA